MARGRDRTCAACDAAAVETRTMPHRFAYADGARDVVLAVDVPVECCAACGEMFLGQDGVMAKHEAVCSHLGRLPPSGIKAIRKGMGLDRKAFAGKIGVDQASLKRWEAGAVIQDESTDGLLRRAARGRYPPRAGR